MILVVELYFVSFLQTFLNKCLVMLLPMKTPY